MKKAGDLMHELGFREDAPDELKKAFIRNLMKAAFPNAPLPELDSPPPSPQLEFDLDARDPLNATRNAG